MCDYSLHAQKTRKAAVGDKLVVSGFRNTATRGMRRPSIEDVDTATCMLPGTEVAFDEPVAVNDQPYAFMYGAAKRKVIDSHVARFRQLDRELPCRHHDALEFANGDIVLINDLVEDQKLTVLQLGCEVPAAEPTETDEVIRTIATRLPADTLVVPGFPGAIRAGLTSSEPERIEDLAT